MTINAPDLAAHAAIASTLPKPRLIIGGEMRDSGSVKSVMHINTTTGQEQGLIPLGGAAEIDAAVAAALRAFPAWRDMKPSKRRQIMDRFADLIEANIQRFADIAVVENGVPSSTMVYGMIDRALGWSRYYAGWADKIEGLVTGVNPGDHFEYTFPEPYGVIGHIITWNAPLLSLTMKIPPSLAAGNCVVIKPAEFTPYTSQLFTELALEAGIPEGVINVVPGSVEAGEALVRHPGIDKISFTGGPIGAKAIMRSAADTLKPLVFELGGKSANVVFPDVDLEETAAYSAIFGFSNSGQGCALPTRVIVHEDIYDRFVDIIAATIQNVAVGDPLDLSTIVGPMVNAAAIARVNAMLEEARVSNVGRIIEGRALPDELKAGNFVMPTLIADADPNSKIALNEVFGPVLAVMKFKTEDEAVALANGTEYGLGAYVQTNDLNVTQRMVRRLKSGSVFVNRATPSFNPATPFGGLGLSGFGREGGRAGLEEFVRIKGVAISIKEG